MSRTGFAGEDVVIAEAHRRPAAEFRWFDPRTGRLHRPMPATGSGRYIVEGAKGRGRDWLLFVR